MNWTKFRKIFTAAVVSLAVISGTAVSASADTTGGIGGGGGPGGAYSGFEWVSIVNNKGAAYNDFKYLSGWGNYADTLVNQRIGSNGVNICKDSNVIWFIRSSQGGWTYNYTGATHGQWWSGYGTIENASSKYGFRAPIADEVQRFKDWDAGQNGRKIDNVPGYTIICSGKFIQPQKDWNTWSASTTYSNTSASFTEPYSWTTTIAPQYMQGSTTDKIGAANLHNQTSGAQKTEFGKLYDIVNTTAGQGMSTDDLNNRANAAKAADAAAGRPTVNLDDANKTGMAEGGILNVSTTARNATISTTERTATTVATSCYYTQTWNSYWAAYNAPTSSCSSTTSKNVSRTSSKNAPATQQLKGFWQMLSVHCNKEEFDALMASDSSLRPITTPDPTNKISGVAYTKNYTSIPSSLDFGNASNANAAKAKTGNLNFFDKECPFDCTPLTSNSNASTGNGAINNIGGAGAVNNTDNIKASAFEFFRDNAPKKITVDTWFPKAEAGVEYSGEAPVSTTITRDAQGTPSLDGSSGGKFVMKSTNGNVNLFTGTSTNVNNQKNWNSTTFSGPTSTILKGLHREFTVQSTWASEAGKPQAFNFKWEYAPKVKTTVPVSDIGFGVGTTQKVGTTGSVITTIEGKCYNFFGVTAPPSDTTAEFGANTGTGTTNNLDGKMLTGDKAIAKLSTNFVRSASE